MRRVLPRRLRAALADGLVPVVAGFQGIGTHGELTTLGRGGTDLSAVVLAVALRAARCELFKDVGGVMEADPHLVPAARRLDEVDALQLELLAEQGAEVVHPVAVRRARRGRHAAAGPRAWTPMRRRPWCAPCGRAVPRLRAC